MLVPAASVPSSQNAFVLAIVQAAGPARSDATLTSGHAETGRPSAPIFSKDRANLMPVAEAGPKLRTVATALKVRLLPKERKAIAKAPTENVEAYTYFLKGRQYFHNTTKTFLTLARRMFVKAVEIDPGYGEAQMMVGALLKFDSKRRNEAIEAYENALKINPKLVGAYEALGEIYQADKQEKKAEEAFRKGIDADPKHMAGRFALGRMLVKQGRLKEARELWDGRTSDTDNTFPNFIQVLERAERLKKATDAAVQNPNDPEALFNLGVAIMEGDHWVVDGRQERAIIQFRRALELKPDYTQAQYQMVKAYIQWADMFSAQNKNVDVELAKLRRMDPKLAAELVAYRKEYKTGLIGEPVK